MYWEINIYIYRLIYQYYTHYLPRCNNYEWLIYNSLLEQCKHQFNKHLGVNSLCESEWK